MDIASGPSLRTGPAETPVATSSPFDSGEIQQYGTVRETSQGLTLEVKMHSCERLNQLMADTQILYALYMKHHWVMGGVTNYQLHLLMGKLASEQSALVEAMASRIHRLGGVPVGDPRHIGEIAQIPRAPNGREEVPPMLFRLLTAAEVILSDAHLAATKLRELGDDATVGLIQSEVIRTNDIHVRILSEHFVKSSSHPCRT